MNIIQTEYFRSGFGEMILGDYEGQLCLCDWRYRKMRKAIDSRIQNKIQAGYVMQNTTLLEEAKEQLTEYFQGQRKEFSLPILLAGSDFQRSVWEYLLTIPYGHILSYLSLSRQLGNEKAIRAVAAANGANAISIIVPCHRIVGSDGELTGYAGGLTVKRKLLEMEMGGSLFKE